MRLSENTKSILENLSTINPSIILRPGNEIRVGTPGLTLFCTARVDETFERQVGIYNLKKFLGVLSLLDGEPELVFGDGSISISNGKQAITYVLSDQSLIKASPDHDPGVPAPITSFELPASELATTLKASSVLGLPTVAFVGDGTHVKIVARDGSNSSKDAYTSIICESSHVFDVPLPRTSFKMMNLDYTVHVHNDYAKFDHPSITYWLPRQIV